MMAFRDHSSESLLSSEGDLDTKELDYVLERRPQRWYARRSFYLAVAAILIVTLLAQALYGTVMEWFFAPAVVTLDTWKETSITSETHVQYVSELSSEKWPWREYRTSSHTPPHFKITHNSSKPLAPGYIFVTPSVINGRDGTMEQSGTGFIMTMDGDLMYAAEENSDMAYCTAHEAGMTDFRAQDYNGKRYLTYWNGCNNKNVHWGHRWGHVAFIDETYSNFTLDPKLDITTLDAANVGRIDVHEHQMTDRNTMLVSSYNNSQHDLSAVGGAKDAWIADGMFFEIDIATQQPIFEWRALDHLPLNASRMPWRSSGGATEKAPWDWFHINSVQAVGENYLISARHHWTVYMVSGKDGQIIWSLDGITGGSFGSNPAPFKWQHHARATNVTENSMVVSLFNNKVNGEKNEHTQTQGLAYRLSLPPTADRPPVVVRQIETDSERLYAGTQGSYQTDVGDGHQFIGYGSLPICREYGPAADGSDLRWQAQFGYEDKVQSYRVFKGHWKGTPAHWDPSLVLEERHEQSTFAYVSWNGATEIDSWAVWAGPDKYSMESIGVAKKQGFETKFKVDSKTKCIQVGALERNQLIRRSNIACI